MGSSNGPMLRSHVWIWSPRRHDPAPLDLPRHPDYPARSSDQHPMHAQAECRLWNDRSTARRSRWITRALPSTASERFLGSRASLPEPGRLRWQPRPERVNLERGPELRDSGKPQTRVQSCAMAIASRLPVLDGGTFVDIAAVGPVGPVGVSRFTGNESTHCRARGAMPGRHPAQHPPKDCGSLVQMHRQAQLRRPANPVLRRCRHARPLRPV